MPDVKIKRNPQEYVVNEKTIDNLRRFVNEYAKFKHSGELGFQVVGMNNQDKVEYYRLLSDLLEKKIFLHSKDDEDLEFMLRNLYFNKNLAVSCELLGDSKKEVFESFIRGLYKKMGLCGSNVWIAKMELELIKQGQYLYDAFEVRFGDITGERWIDVRDDCSDYVDDIRNILSDIGASDSSLNSLDRYVADDPVGSVDLYELIHGYVDAHSDIVHIVFLVRGFGKVDWIVRWFREYFGELVLVI